MSDVSHDEVVRIFVLHERELREQQAKALERALELQAKEYDRRLEDLNHAHARALSAEAHTVQQAVYDATMEDLDVWKASVKEDIAVLRGEVGKAKLIFGLVLAFGVPAMTLLAGILLK